MGEEWETGKGVGVLRGGRACPFGCTFEILYSWHKQLQATRILAPITALQLLFRRN